jgi:transposase
MIDMLKRHAIQVLRQAGHTLDEVATFVGVSRKSVQRVVAEPEVTHDDTDRERIRRHVGRPSKAEPYRSRIEEWLSTGAGAAVGRAAAAGQAGVRPTTVRPIMCFEGLPGGVQPA